MFARRTVLGIALTSLAATALGSGAPMAQGRPAGSTVTVQVLAINDFHGNLEPPQGLLMGAPVGGAEYLATHVKNAVAANSNSIFVASGDLIGAAPMLSAFFHSEPTIEAMNAMKLAVSAVGNHEFDKGGRELLRMQRGGCHPTDGCQDGDGFAGAAFRYLAANVVRTGGVKPAALFPATTVRTIGGVRVGFIGVVLKGTPREESPAAVRGFAFLDEATTANRYAASLERQGVKAIVLLIHQGGRQVPDAGQPIDANGCAHFAGPLADILPKLSPIFKVVISGHTHQPYNCTIDGRSVTSASAFGRVLTRVDMRIDTRTDTVVDVKAVNELVTRDVAKDPAQTAIMAKYGRLAAPLANKVTGSVTADILRRQNDAGESALGDVVADAQLAAASPPDRGGAVVAFMNSPGIRADILADHQGGGEAPGELTYGELFTVQPFNNVLTVMTMTGDLIKRLLEEQFADNTNREVLQVSQGFTYRYSLHAPKGQRVDPASIAINGVVVAPTARVRIVTNDFLAGGGSGFSAFVEGQERIGGDVDIDALVAYVRTHSPVAPGPQNRIVRVD